ncbi:MAG: endopeptidase La [Nitrospiraceae bacterium]|jgi:ATP-dependent Lon protease|uniref:endopeptidase La n=1 Tax=Nitrospira cf. moscoviensis SBR1015 TaxID=96242 RepID=UPI000B3BB4DE|nr:endopeptidase La [Nitrospira cf. moscoviensis SBR1015]MBY0246111.1 endopeptidase La [Nitrospiraceae bacterium]
MTEPNEQELQPPQNVEIPSQLPLLPVRDIVVFPYMVLPLFVGRDMSIKAIEAALAGNRMIFLATQKALDVENPTPEEIHTIGTVGIIMRMLKLPDERIKILVQGVAKARIAKYIQTDPYYSVKIDKLPDTKPASTSLEAEAVMRTVKEQIERIVSLGKVLIPDVMVVIENLEEPGRLADMVASNLGLKVDVTQAVLESIDPIQRLRQVSEILGKEIEVLSMQQKIQAQAKGEMDKTQREYFLREQLKAIQKELGELDERAEEVTEFRKRIKDSAMPDKVLKEAEKQLKRLEKMHPDTAESSTVRTYLEWMVELPWSKRSKDNLDLKAAAAVLNEDHYDLEKVKERILEYLAVRKLKEKMKGPILCFVGPPGVGKTSLGKSIARALGREFVRISLGGVRDEAEIRGHRRTYVGALPGRIIQGMKQAGTSNPVFMLDEVDKVGMDFRGDPSAALLEVLDPEQNNAFTDHYLGVPFDLTEVMFITTSNLIDPILPALRDRMEIIEIPGYTEEEKLGIAQKYLIPRQLEEHGITGKHVRIDEAALRNIIAHYTREAGVRNLEREIANVMRKVAKKVAEGKGQGFPIDQTNLQKYLGVPKYVPEAELEKDEIGVATGLAWTEAGGDVLYIEATIMKGKGQLTLTGHLGDVMKESAQAALSYVRSREKTLHIDPDMFSTQDLHIHVPAGAIPKDGPSAGITMATAIASALSGIPTRRDLAMTGEITLRGRVLAIGGLKEKILAAKRAKLTTVILPRRNKKDLEEIPKHILKGIQLSFADTMDDVMKIALRRSASAAPAKKRSSPSTALTRSKSAPSGRRKRDGRIQEIPTTLMPRQFSRID